MPLILGTNSIKDTTYTIANSCRFNDDDSAYMHKTPGSAGNRRTFTISCWIKNPKQGATSNIIMQKDTSNADVFSLQFKSTGELEVWDYSSSAYQFRLTTNAKYRDPSAWMHICVAVDTTQGTNTNRVKLYVNGSQITSLGTSTYPSQNYDCNFNENAQQTIGTYAIDSNSQFADHYLAEFVFIDGSALAASSFGEFNEDSPQIWQPKDVSGLTFGTNGFYLDFEDSANLGNDANGGTDFTEVNLAAADQAVDSPTNNFATLNPLDNYYQASTFSEGNCKIVTHDANYPYNTSTIGVVNGRWYFEAKVTNGASMADVGIDEDFQTGSTSDYPGKGANAVVFKYNGDYRKNDSSAAFTPDASAMSNNDIIGVFLDCEDNKVYFSVNGSLLNSGNGVSISATPASGNYFFVAGDEDSEGAGSVTWECNFGGCSAFSLSSAVNDDNGYGNFEYTPNVTVDSTAKKFYALCTKNLAEYG